MKRVVLASVLAVMVVIGFFALYTKSNVFRTKYNKVENKISETLYDTANKIGVKYPNVRVLNDDEVVVKFGGDT